MLGLLALRDSMAEIARDYHSMRRLRQALASFLPAVPLDDSLLRHTLVLLVDISDKANGVVSHGI